MPTRLFNTDKMYDNVMNKFKWGGVDKPGVYIDENVMRMCKSYRMMLFNKLAEALVKEGKNDKALEVLDKCMQVLPPENVPLDYTALSTGELYYVLGQKEKAAEIFTGIADNMMRNINWYFRLNPVQLASVETELLQDMQVLTNVLLITNITTPNSTRNTRKSLTTTVWLTNRCAENRYVYRTTALVLQGSVSRGNLADSGKEEVCISHLRRWSDP